MLVVAPLTNVIYRLFDPMEGLPLAEGHWFYVNDYYFLQTLGPHLFLAVSLAGAYLMFPEHSKRAAALIIPFGYSVGKILFLSIAASNEEVNALVPSSFILLGILLGIVARMTHKVLLDRKYHKHDGIVSRILGLMKARGIDEATRIRLLEEQFNEWKSFQTKY